ncbi:Hypothetical protein A7982_00071 [Minicystis rosea]|nr:Hypothetical protein A7982_00071 [Minicystis rosea]
MGTMQGETIERRYRGPLPDRRMLPLSRPRAALAGLFVALVALATPSARAQSAAPPATKAQKSNASEAQRKDEARDHFQRGIALFDEESWDAAFVEFERARALYPSRAATKNAALCLRLMKRYEEALATFEDLVAMPNLTKEDQELGEKEIIALRRLVGTIEVASAEPNATVLVDRRVRGKTPLARVRVAVGTHEVRVVKDGFEPYATRIYVPGGESVRVSPLFVRPGMQATPVPAAPPVKQRDLLTPAAITLGLGGLSLGVGAVFGGLTVGKVSAIRDHCASDVCPKTQLAASQSARTMATTSTIGFVVGGALATTGLTLLVLRSVTRKSSASVVIGPTSVLAQGAF